MTPDFAEAKAAATRLLLAQHLYSLRIDVTKLRYEQNIIFDSMQHFCLLTRTTLAALSDGSDCLRDGCTLIRRRGGELFYIVLYNADISSRGRRGFTLAHEVGHICMGHAQDGDLQEQEANCFAAQLLAPGALVRELARRARYPIGACDLQAVFAVSRQAAENRLFDLTRRQRPTPDELALLQRLAHLLPDCEEPVVNI